MRQRAGSIVGLADARVLEELHDLYEAGGLSESEFNSKKWEILSRG